MSKLNSKILGLINSSKGHFVGGTFVKKNGDGRVMNVQPAALNADGYKHEIRKIAHMSGFALVAA